MVKLNKIYTKTGDDGSTSLADGTRVEKHSPRPAAYGSVDELNSVLGVMISLINENDGEFLNLFKLIQNDLFDLGADLSTPFTNNTRDLRITLGQISHIEKIIDKYNNNLNP